MTTIASKLASTLQAMAACENSNNTEWYGKHKAHVLDIVKRTAPSGSGIDCGTQIDLDKSTSTKLVFTLSYHHMNEAGYYDGWTNHEVVVTGSLTGLVIKIKGNNRNDIKDHLYETYSMWLESEREPADFWKPELPTK
jgi:hypothetical protein